MEMQIVIYYAVAFILTFIQILFAYLLTKWYKPDYLRKFFIFIIINSLVGLLYIAFGILLPKMISSPEKQELQIGIIFSLTTAPLTMLCHYTFITFLLSLIRKYVNKLFKIAYFTIWGLFFVAYVYAAMLFFAKGSTGLFHNLGIVYQYGIRLFAPAVCLYTFLSGFKTENKMFRLTVLSISAYYLLYFIITIGTTVTMQPGFAGKIIVALIMISTEIPPLIALFIYQMKDKKHDQLDNEDKTAAGLSEYGISRREKDIIQLILKGKSNKQIGDELYISLRTVETHIYRIYQKLGIKNRIQLLNILSAPLKNLNRLNL